MKTYSVESTDAIIPSLPVSWICIRLFCLLIGYSDWQKWASFLRDSLRDSKMFPYYFPAWNNDEYNNILAIQNRYEHTNIHIFRLREKLSYFPSRHSRVKRLLLVTLASGKSTSLHWVRGHNLLKWQALYKNNGQLVFKPRSCNEICWLDNF